MGDYKEKEEKSRHGACKRGNPQNLIPLNERDPEEARRIRSMGGKACACAKARYKSFEACCRMLLTSRADKASRAALSKMGIDGDDQSAGMVLALNMIRQAIGGNVAAATWVRDTAGEKPTERMEGVQTTELKTTFDVSKVDKGVLKAMEAEIKRVRRDEANEAKENE